MAQHKIAVDSEDLQKFFRKPSRFRLAELFESVLNQILQAQVKEQLAAEPYERTEELTGHRNGSYRQVTTGR